MSRREAPRPHLLVVDDEPGIIELLRLVLEQAGYRVSVAADGVDALAAWERSPAQLLLTDSAMPRLTGEALVARLRAHDPTLPAVVLTGYTGRGALSDARTVVLDKPIRIPVLLRTIASLLEAAEASPSGDDAPPPGARVPAGDAVPRARSEH